MEDLVAEIVDKTLQPHRFPHKVRRVLGMAEEWVAMCLLPQGMVAVAAVQERLEQRDQVVVGLQ
jgi:hypothetical protein